MLNFINSVNRDNCQKMSEEQLNLKGDITYGAEEQFKNEVNNRATIFILLEKADIEYSQALMAVRTANFISGFLQVISIF